MRAMFMSHIDFVVEHPGVPRMMFGELQRTGDSLPRRMVRTLLDAKVFLELFVKVRSGWADSEEHLRSYGYE